MGRLSAKKDDAEWKRHKNTLRKLYYEDKLSQSDVQKFMKTKGFNASRAQYERYFKSCAELKNLKKGEWRAVLQEFDEIKATQLRVRIRRPGKVYTDAEIRRARNSALKDEDQSFSARPECIFFETQDANGEWSVYREEEATEPVDSTVPIIDESFDELLVSLNSGELVYDTERQQAISFDRPSHSSAAVTMQLSRTPSPRLDSYGRQNLNNYGLQSFRSPRNDFIGSEMPGFGLYDFYNYGTPDLGEYIPHWSLPVGIEDSFQISSWDHMLGQSHMRKSSSRHSIPPPSRNRLDQIVPTKQNQLSIFAQLSQIKFTRFSPALWQDDTLSPTIRDMLANLFSSLPDGFGYNYSEWAANSVVKRTIFDSPFYLAILHSISNDFAGLRDVPRKEVFQMLKHPKDFVSRIRQWIKQNSGARARCFTVNLFRAAVEVSDESVVEAILRVTKGSSYAIDVNSVVCTLRWVTEPLTPVEAAAWHHNGALVQLLIDAEADVNKTYGKHDFGLNGALAFALRRERETDPGIIRAILNAGGEVQPWHVDFAYIQRSDKVIQECLLRIPAHRHQGFVWMTLRRAQHIKSPQLVFVVLQHFQKACESQNCINCPIQYKLEIQEALVTVVRRGITEAVDVLERWCPSVNKEGCLAAAVRSGQSDLIQRFLSKTSLGDRPQDFDDSTQTKYTQFRHPLTTPLAEAIRSQDTELLDKFVEMGALTHLQTPGHLEAAVFAAAQFGNLDLLRNILERAPGRDMSNLSSALAISIKNDNIQAVLFLLERGVRDDDHSTVLCEALGKLETTIIPEDDNLKISLESPHTTHRSQNHAVWRQIIEDLLFMQNPGISVWEIRSPLTIAVRAGDLSLVKLLLDVGYSLNFDPEDDGIGDPLTAAVETESSEEMIRLLVSRGADPANEKAFLVAATKPADVFDTLLHCFSEIYPNGKPGFGAASLINALQNNDMERFRKLLDAHFDTKSFILFEQSVVNTLGQAIRCGKEEEQIQAVMDQLLQYQDPDCIVEKLSAWETKDDHKGHKTALLLAIEMRQEKVIDDLLKKGANVNFPALKDVRRTPLQRACEIGSLRVANILIQHRALVNEPAGRYYGGTALQFAAKSGCVKVARLLLELDAEVHAPSSYYGGRTALEAAAESGGLDMVTVIWEAALNTGERFTSDQIARAKKLAISSGSIGCAELLDTLQSELDRSWQWPLGDPVLGIQSQQLEPDYSAFSD